jgi:hypothetical protein
VLLVWVKVPLVADQVRDGQGRSSPAPLLHVAEKSWVPDGTSVTEAGDSAIAFTVSGPGPPPARSLEEQARTELMKKLLKMNAPARAGFHADLMPTPRSR